MSKVNSENAHQEPRQRSVQCASPSGLHRMAYTEWGDPANPNVLICVHGLSRNGRDLTIWRERWRSAIASSARMSSGAAGAAACVIRRVMAFHNTWPTW